MVLIAYLCLSNYNHITMLLRQIIQRLDDQDHPALYQDVTFRQKDAVLLREEASNKYRLYIHMVKQKHQLEQKTLTLKEELCKINPEALEEIQRDCSQRNESEEDIQTKRKAKVNKPLNKNIKKNERRKKAPKLTYS